jgi:type IV pilus assembly protein PilM
LVLRYVRKKRSLLGLDITTSSVKVVELSLVAGQYRVECLAVEPMPPNAISDRTVAAPQAVGEAIARAVRRSGSACREVAMAVSGTNNHLAKIIQMPVALREEELEIQIELQADQYLEVPVDELSLDFQIMSPSSRDRESVDVLLVASRMSLVSALRDAAGYAGLTPRVIDIESYAIENATQLLRHQMPDGGVDRVIALVDFGATSTTFTVLRDNKLAYSRDFNFGGQQLTESIMRSYGLTIEEAGRAKKEGGLPGNYQSDVLDPFIDDMNQQVIRARQFYMAAGNDREQPEKILVCGGCSNIPGVADLMASRLGIAAEKADPIGQINVTPLARSQGAQREANSLIVALGLALRNFD